MRGHLFLAMLSNSDCCRPPGKPRRVERLQQDIAAQSDAQQRVQPSLLTGEVHAKHCAACAYAGPLRLRIWSSYQLEQMCWQHVQNLLSASVGRRNERAYPPVLSGPNWNPLLASAGCSDLCGLRTNVPSRSALPMLRPRKTCAFDATRFITESEEGTSCVGGPRAHELSCRRKGHNSRRRY
jgi:hypothetical protein